MSEQGHFADQIARHIAGLTTPLNATTTRRHALGRLAAAVTGVIVGGGVLAEAAEAGGSKRKKKCKKAGSKCSQDASAYCAAFWPGAFALCKRDLGRCCKKLRQCQRAEAQLCAQNSGW